ncbi:NAD-dependent epimerase/dehydratase family protein [Micromonospora peucetia]|uniref:Nucleoside-diphosphate-sugar epimerase n=1 Tax=Micromonospora peucetia TaxID=47871 RepID=A0A1C6W5N1_9ACTN|nr:NAD-dependent epimerase/dehydratase family protein [Micromonospora peucetia]MCX4390056.1 NAD-dependent epimerase/dehydratase family protein [Micromonospora peucetia]SCL73500.1 Nucleoside-diphosphate-sugar epimerase [Micromonospora peucetia]
MKILVTGASGMLGAAVATALRMRGDEVRVLQRRPSGLVGVDERRGDITDPEAVRAAAEGVDAVVHLAAKVSMTGPWQQFEHTNIGGTATLLAAARAAGVTRFVHVSSPSVAHHGAGLVGVGAGAADPDRARGHYARSKASAELLALDADSPDFAVVAVRPHLVWGPGDTQLVGRIVERARASRLALVGQGTALIDTTYVSNAADALVAALDRAPEVGVHGQVFVVTNGEPRTMHELIDRICVAAETAPPRLRVPVAVAKAGGAAVECLWSALRRTEEPPMTRFLAEQLSTAHWFDQRRTREALCWSPQVTLEEGFVRLALAYRQGPRPRGRRGAGTSSPS